MPSSKRWVRLTLEELESRLAPAMFNVNSVSTLLSAIQQADSDGNPSDTIILSAGTYTLGGNEIQIVNHPVAATSLFIQGQTESNTILSAAHLSRVIGINGNANLTVKLQDLTITNGAVDSATPNVVAQGGGLLIDGGNVALSDVAVSQNAVVGAQGAEGAAGATGQIGGTGGNGGAAQGGGIYLASGNLTLTHSTIFGNTAFGGSGGKGGNGGNQAWAATASNSRSGHLGATGALGFEPTTAGANGGEGQKGSAGQNAQNAPALISLHNGAGGTGGAGGNVSVG